MKKYVSKLTTKLYTLSNPRKEMIELLWGDEVTIISGAGAGWTKVRARNCNGVVKTLDLGDKPLLELYFIDVGQGDGVLIITPDRKHLLLDGGYNRNKQPHGKSAADFVDWKFAKDYGLDTIKLDAMIASHNDADHYGGLWDLVNLDEMDDLDCKAVSVKNFYHAGVSWWKNGAGKRSLGRKEDGYLVDIIGSRTSVKKALDGNGNGYSLQGEWAQFLKAIYDTRCDVQRMGYLSGKPFDYIPGFGPGENDVKLKVLGPMAFRNGNGVKLRDLGSDSQNTNGNSIMLRVDYGRTRILLTGDLNKKSQQDILEAFKGQRQELAADIVKGCHHGSDDCSYEFLETVQASATIISSGDDETHAHPRPNIVAASGATGFKAIEKDEMITPLVYSTEISRSLKLGDPYKAVVDKAEHEEEEVNVFYNRVASGALKPARKEKPLSELKVVDGIVYGLVNVRTDGENIICATLNEGKHKWEIKKFRSRF